MKKSARSLLQDIGVTAAITFIVAAVVTYLYSLLVHGAGVVDWGTAVQLALVFGLVLPLTRYRAVKADG